MEKFKIIIRPLRSHYEEAKGIFSLAIPVFLTNLVQFGMGIADNMFLGHLGPKELASGSLSNVWLLGTSILASGLVFGMDTLGSQAYGAGNFGLVGIVLQNALFSLTFFSIPVMFLWFFTEDVLILMGQNPELASMCGIYSRILLPSLWPLLYYQALQRYLQVQGNVYPALIVGAVSFIANIIFNYLFIFSIGMGFIGSPIATMVSRFLVPLFLWLYIWKRKIHKKTWQGWSSEMYSIKRLKIFFKYAIFGGLMIAIEVWGFESAGLFVGLFQSPILISVHTIVLNTLLISFLVPLSLSVGASIRIGNLLGEGEPIRAKRTVQIASIITGGCMLINAIGMVTLGKVYAQAYTTNLEVIVLVGNLMWLAALVTIFDGLQTVQGGFLRGIGYQNYGTLMNFIGYYLIAIPSYAVLGIVLGWSLFGMWIGLLTAVVFICLGNFLFLVRINFAIESEKVQLRVGKTEQTLVLMETLPNTNENTTENEESDRQEDDSRFSDAEQSLLEMRTS